VPLNVLELNVEDATEKPVGVVQAPEAVVQICAWYDWNVAVVPVVKAKVYVVVALDAAALELLIVSFLALN
jgi:hypothetical protein